MDLSNYVLSHIPSVLKLSGLIVSKELYVRDLSDLVVDKKLKIIKSMLLEGCLSMPGLAFHF